MTKSALYIQRRYRARKGAAPTKHGMKVNRLLLLSYLPLTTYHPLLTTRALTRALTRSPLAH